MIANVMDRELEGNEPFLLALGRLVTAAALLETEIAAAIEWLLEPREGGAGEVVTAAMDFRNKANVLGALSSECGLAEVRATRLSELAKRAHALHNDRNHFIHGFWHVRRADMATTRHVAKIRLDGGVFRLTLRPVRAEDIHALANRFVECAQDIDAALKDHTRGQP